MENEFLTRAFPSSLHSEVNGLLNQFNLSSQHQSSGSFNVWVTNENLQIPYRIYFTENNLDIENRFQPVQNTILKCIFSRHHNGYIREQCLREIVLVDQVWVLPFVFRLLGEYLIEILDVIFTNLPNIDSDLYVNFLENNNDFYETIKRRVISYWDCYYRREYNKFDDYIGAKIIKHFDDLVGQSLKAP